MAKKKRTSKVLELAQTRAVGLKSIAVAPDLRLGKDLTVGKYLELIDNTNNKLEIYNISLAQSDQAQNEFEDSEAILNEAYSQVLTGIATQFGRDSSEYEQAGGVRKSERKKPVRKAKPEKEKSNEEEKAKN